MILDIKKWGVQNKVSNFFVFPLTSVGNTNEELEKQRPYFEANVLKTFTTKAEAEAFAKPHILMNELGNILSKRIKLSFENIVKVQDNTLTTFDITTIFTNNGKLDIKKVKQLIHNTNNYSNAYHILGATCLIILNTLQDTIDGVDGVSLDTLSTDDPSKLRKDIDDIYDVIKDKELNSLEHLGYNKNNMNLVRKYLSKDKI